MKLPHPRDLGPFPRFLGHQADLPPPCSAAECVRDHEFDGVKQHVSDDVESPDRSSPFPPYASDSREFPVRFRRDHRCDLQTIGC
ncbi:unnamed protein product [Linum trigynum]|uniref:Uncharacterized protein n=1 Tax=Linum trigynum TaxID=586398 RepID=A0AAV2GF39_9ROSI